MKILLSWINDFVKIDNTPEYIADKLIDAGFEVEGIEYEKEQIKNVVTGKILSVNKHENADSLFVCSVDINKDLPIQIVTNSKDVYPDAIVPVALDGAELASGLKIKKGKIRGTLSLGMFCSGAEFNITDNDYKGASYDGVLVLDKNEPIGIDINEIIDKNDVILDISIPTSRPDCNSVYGIAKELATILELEFIDINLNYNTISNNTKDELELIVTNKSLTQNYIAHIVDEFKIAPSPLIIQKRLKKLGHNLYNNIVDITNYVLLELGQPTHAFDYSKIKGKKIITRNATNDETIKLLDENTYKLNDTNAVIANEQEPMAVAGIMGGYNYSVNSSTKKIVLESARFARDNIRRTSRFLNLHSTSSQRFEKGVDFGLQKKALDRILHLIDKYNLGKIYLNSVNVSQQEKDLKVLEFPYYNVKNILGIDIPIEKSLKILNSLSIKTTLFKNKNSNIKNLRCVIPVEREDIFTKNDICEEIIRIYGYDKIKSTILKNSTHTIGGKSEYQKIVSDIKNYLVSNEFYENMSLSFTSPNILDDLMIENNERYNKLLTILNPLGIELSVMRTTLIYSMLNTVSYNLKQNNSYLKMFELAKTYHKIDEKNISEEYNLVLAISTNNANYYELANLVKNILNKLVLNVEFVDSKTEFLNKNISQDIYVNKKYIGCIGAIHPKVCQNMEINKQVFLCELNIDLLYKYYKNSYNLETISKYPSVSRDLSIIIDDHIRADEIIEVVKKSGSKLLKEVKIYDVYKDKKINDGKKSVSFTMKFQSNEKTLTDKDLKRVDYILKQLEILLGARLR